MAFADPENVFLLTEDFESGTLGDFEDRTGGTSWYTADPWTRRIPITIPSGTVSGPLSDFPLLVSLTSADLAANAQLDGSDIRFTTGDGTTPLAHEIDSWNAATGALETWVLLPSLEPSSSTTIYLYYGAPNAPTHEDVRRTWPTAFEGAWHLSRSPVGTAPQLDDSTVRNHDGLSSGSMTSGDLVGGIVGSGIDFDGTDDTLTSDPFDMSRGAVTLSGWVNLDAHTNAGRIINKGYSSASSVFELSVTSSGDVRARITLDGATTTVDGSGGGVTLGAWHHVAMTWDGSTIRLYLDGAQVASQPASGATATDPAMPVTIGGLPSADRQIDGLIDEVRMSRVARSAAWIASAEANQRNPGAFHSVGALQSGTWFDQGAWSARKPVVVDADRVSTNATDFTLLVEVTDPELQSGALASGDDLVFTDADGTTRLDHTIEPGLVFESWWWFSSDTGVDLAAGTRAGTSPTDQYEAALTSSSGWELRQRSGGSGSFDAPAAGSPTAGTWTHVEIRTDQHGDTRLFIDGVEVTTATPQGSALLSGSMALRVGLLPSGESWFIDDARGRKLVTPEPVATVGPLDRD